MALTDLLVAVAIGFAFGVALERAGLGSARKLTGQFFLRDFTVFKVMFTAIVTAMLGLFWLGRLGMVNLAFLYVPETYLLPQVAGGLIFGAGFVLAGLCPGTSCVAAASGRGDGAAVVIGLFAGVLVTGLSFPALRAFYESGGHGAWTLPQLLQVPYGLVVFGVVAVALLAFAAAERIGPRSTRNTLGWPRIARVGLVIAALALGAASAVARTPAPRRVPVAAAPAPAATPFKPASGC
jgi:uncharacterized protein